MDRLGQGGMGEVFLAEDTQLGRKVAVKFLAQDLEADATSRERLVREARSAAALDHPYICKVHEICELDGRTGIVMEHVVGDTLQTVLAKSPLEFRRVLEIVSEMAEALEAAHRARMVHRDLKPANVMLTHDGHIKVMDFGLAKPLVAESHKEGSTTQGALTGSGVRVGTPAYMSPEQLVGGVIDERSDIFAFGVVFYEFLAGVHPFRRPSQSGMLSAILREAPAPASQRAREMPDRVRVVLERMLAKDPRERHQSFAEVRTDLADILEDSSGVNAIVTTSEPAADARRTQFVARESERTEMSRWLGRAISGQGGLLLVGGEPGVGKTRLAEELLLEGRTRGCLALTGRCYETEGTPPFIPWVEVLQQSARVAPPATFRALLGDSAPEIAKLLPELRQKFEDIPSPVELPPEQQRRFLFTNFQDFLERGSRTMPHIMLLDDLHWADESTLLLLQHVARHLAEMPVLIVGTYRDVDLEVGRPFAEMLESLTRHRLAHKLPLDRFEEDEVGAMLQALSGQTPPPSLARVVYAETEGNPFFTEEVFHHLSEEGRLFDADGAWRSDLRVDELEVPEGVRLVIGRRLQRLTEDTRKVLTGAAVSGRSFDLRLLQSLGAADGDALLTALEEAEAAKLIVPSGRRREVRWEFAHGLIRQTLADSLSLMRRQRLHLRVAEAMETLHAANLERFAADIAHHFYQAGVAADIDKTVRFLTLAGDVSVQAGAFDEALRQFTEALSVQEEEGTGEELADLRYRRALALRSLGRFEESVQELTTALEIFERLDDVGGIARSAFNLADQTSWLRTREARVVAKRALERVGDRDPVARARMLGLVARFSGLAGDPYQISIDAMDQADARAATLAQPDLTTELRAARSRLHWSYNQFPEAIECGLEAMAALQARGELYEVAEVGWQVYACQVLTGRWGEADELMARLESQHARAGHNFCRWVVRGFALRQRLLLRGDLQDVAEACSGNFAWAIENAPLWRGYDLAARADAYFFAGRWKEAMADYAEVNRLEPGGFMDGHHRSIELVTGAYAGADVLEDLLEGCERLRDLAGEHPTGLWDGAAAMVEGLRVVGRWQEAGSLYESVRRGLEKGRVMTMHSRCWEMAAGIAAGGARKWDAAQAHFESVLQKADESPALLAQPEVRRWYGQMLLERDQPGDTDKARTLLHEATEMYCTIGMPKHLEMVEKMSAGL